MTHKDAVRVLREIGQDLAADDLEAYKSVDGDKKGWDSYFASKYPTESAFIFPAGHPCISNWTPPGSLDIHKEVLVKSDAEFVKLFDYMSNGSAEEFESFLGVEFAFADGVFPSDIDKDPSLEASEDLDVDFTKFNKKKDNNFPESYPCVVCIKHEKDFDRAGDYELFNMHFVYPSHFEGSSPSGEYERGVEDMRQTFVKFIENYIGRGEKELKTSPDAEDRAFIRVLNDQAAYYLRQVADMKVKEGVK